MCHEARQLNAAVSCPVDPGTYTIVQTVTLPKEIPTGKHRVAHATNLIQHPAKFGVRVRGFTADNEDMMCLGMSPDVSIVSSRPNIIFRSQVGFHEIHIIYLYLSVLKENPCYLVYNPVPCSVYSSYYYWESSYLQGSLCASPSVAS